jgi:pimeloyl-ACP methyl ester carboxylesterase
MTRHEVSIPASGATLRGTLEVPDDALGLVLFVHGSGSSRHSPRNRKVAHALQDASFATLLFDLLTVSEETDHHRTGSLGFNMALLAQRLVEATEWAFKQRDTRGLPVGYAGSGTGAAAALIAAAALEDRVGAVVSRGGRPDLAGHALDLVSAPTLLIAGERDELVLDINREAYARMHCTRELVVVPHATHLFEEAGALEKVAGLAIEWCRRHLLERLDFPGHDFPEKQHGIVRHTHRPLAR